MRIHFKGIIENSSTSLTASALWWYANMQFSTWPPHYNHRNVPLGTPANDSMGKQSMRVVECVRIFLLFCYSNTKL